MSEINKADAYHHLQTVLKTSKETNFNGQIQKGVQANKAINLEDIKIVIEPVCRKCGKVLNFSTTKVVNFQQALEQGTSKVLCENCASSDLSDSEFTFSPDLGIDCDNSSKRDSGFHTLNRQESKKMESDGTTESALSSASSADSAVSVEYRGSTPDVNSSGSLPSIVVHADTTDMQNGLKFQFNNDECVFQEEGKLQVVGTDFKETPKSLAEKLYNLKGYKRIDVANKLGKNTDFSHQVGIEYLRLFDFSAHSLIDSYREFLSRFALLGETQERERILLHFSQRYTECNPDFLDGQCDSVHTLVCAMTLLNTDLHGNVGLSSGRKKMTVKQFMANLSGLMFDKTDYPKDLLQSLYSSIKKTPLPWGGKEKHKLPRSSSMRQNTETDSGPAPTKIVNRSLSTRSPVKPSKHSSNSSGRGLGRSTKNKSLSHNQGLLWRKALQDSEGKKVSLGKRGWKVYSVALQNLELHIVKRGSTEAKSISLHHSLAEESDNDSKRQHVFRLTLADTSVTLYQASSEKETRKWVRDINKAAALLSAAPLCSPIGSQLVFRKPLLPSAPSTLPMVNQHEKVQKLLKEQEEDLEETQTLFKNDDLNLESIQYYEDKMEYLKYEIKKYKQYVKILQLLLRTSTISTNSETNLESSDNGSLVSMTPSEPPLASPQHGENFVFPGAEGTGNTSSNEAAGVFTSPAHLLSPQHKTLTLSPTSSLPNLSPILESPVNGPLSSYTPVGSSNRRVRKERNLYESSLNDSSLDAEDAMGEKRQNTESNQGNFNNSNHLGLGKPVPPNSNPHVVLPPTHCRRFAESSISDVSEEYNQPHPLTPAHLWNQTQMTKKNACVPITTEAIVTESLEPKHLPGSVPLLGNVRQDQTFPVQRHEIRVVDMETRMHDLSIVNAAERRVIQHPTSAGRKMQQRSVSSSNNSEMGTSDNSAGNFPLFPPSPNSRNTGTLLRVKGRKEKKGIERISYMLAIGNPDES